MPRDIVMIHGMFCSPVHWTNFKRFFEKKGYACHAPMLRYHNGTPPDPRLGMTRVVDYVADLAAFIQELGRPHPPILMGHSMGGLLAQMLGARGLGSALVLVTPAAPYGVLAVTPSVVRCFAPILLRWRSWEKPAQLSYGTAAYAFFGRVPESERRTIYQTLVCESGRAIHEIGNWLLFPRSKPTYVDASGVTMPVLALGGADDRIVPASVVRKLASLYPSAQYREIAGAAHWMMDEPGWEKTAASIFEWLLALGMGGGD